MTFLTDILNVDQLDRDIENGYVRQQFHPEFPYTILNYTEKAQYENYWNASTLNCRGLIVDHNGNIIARPFPKFFNYSQLTDPPSPDTKLVSVTDKMDGSLGIIYFGPDDLPYVTTRGSFTSEQALWASEWLAYNYEVFNHHIDWNWGTFLVEIIYPQNRIVIDYGEREGLVLLGVVDIGTGRILPEDQITPWRWRGERTDTFYQYETLADVLIAPDRENAEGLVALTEDNQLIKFKQEDYVALHRILTGLTERTVYDVLKTDGNVDRLIEIVPDEFHPWVQDVASRLRAEYNTHIETWYNAYDNIQMDLYPGYTQKDFAMLAVRQDCKSALFLIEKDDTERLSDLAWRMIEPPATKATVPLCD